MSERRITNREMELRIMLRRLTHAASCINVVQHSGAEVTPEMWAELYQLTNEAKAVLQCP